MFDFSTQDPSIKAEDGFEFEVKLPNGEPTGAFITVFGSESKVVKDYDKKQLRTYFAEEARAKKTNRPVEKTLEDYEDDSVEAAVVRTKSWRGFSSDGQEVQSTKENFDKFYRKHDWLRAQVLEQSRDALNF